MTEPERGDLFDPSEDAAAPRPPRRRRRPAPAAHPFFRFGFPLVVAAAGLIVALLSIDGIGAVLDSKDGQDVPIVTDPAAPGYLAFVTPTPTMLVAHVDAANALTGVTVLARTELDEGGSIVILSSKLLVDLPVHDRDAILESVYATDGVAGLEAVIGEWFGFGFTDDPMVMDPMLLGEWLGPAAPIPFRLTDDLVEIDDAGSIEVVVESGARSFEATTLADAYGWLNPTEIDASRFQRQEAIWEAWLARVPVAGETFSAALQLDDGLWPYLRSLGTGTADVSLAPMRATHFDPAAPVYSLDPSLPDWLIAKSHEMVPLPIGHTPGARISVQVLDGTGDNANRDAMIPVLVAAGAEISVIGNAPAFGVTETTVSYYLAENEARATAIAEAVGARVQFIDDPAGLVDVELTVTIGSDR